MLTGATLIRRVPALLALVSFCASGAQTVEVTIEDYRFMPQEVRVKSGDAVRWTNREKRTSHSVLFSAEQGGESERLFPQDVWQRRFEAPGRYPYSCGPHPEMKGVVEVVAP